MTFFKRMIIGLFLLLGLLGQTIFATNLDYQIKELPNGIKLVYKVLPGAKTTSARIIFPVGFLNEPPQFSNISHLLEHMVFRGSETYQAEDFQRRVVDRGGNYNAFTMLDRTEYLLESAAEDFIPGFTVYLDQILNPQLTERNIQLEKKIVTVEKVLRDKPGDIMVYYLNNVTANRYENMVRNIKREDLMDYHQRHYQLPQMTVIITGAFDLGDAIATLTALKVSPLSKTEPEPGREMGNSKNETILEDYLQGQEYQLLVSFPLPKLSRKELLVAKTLPYILSYESRNYDPVTGRPLDYDIGILALNQQFFLIFIYQDNRSKFTNEINEWHQKNLVRYCKMLKAKKFDKFLDRLSAAEQKYFFRLELQSASLNYYYAQKLFDPMYITDEDLGSIRRLSTSDFKNFTQKYLEGKSYQKVVIKAL